jgi:small-conductance mechanosensitive channel
MFVRLSLGAGLIAATVIIQALFMSAGLNTFKQIEELRPGALASKPATTTVIWILFLLIPIILDVTLWATFYYAGGALPNFEEALYFSTVTFTTVGYGDIVLDREWRQLATFEAVNGWIIFGWATALIMAVIQRLYFPAK